MIEITFTQGYFVKEGKKIGYVKPSLTHLANDGKVYTYPITFDDKTRKRFNIYARSLGYDIGVVEKSCADSAPSTDHDLPF